jgi:hypothetical protein
MYVYICVCFVCYVVCGVRVCVSTRKPLPLPKEHLPPNSCPIPTLPVMDKSQLKILVHFKPLNSVSEALN